MSVTHVAGPVVGIRDRRIQRCAVCGEKMADNLRVMMPVRPDGTPDTFPTWQEGALVEYDGNRQSVVGDFVKDELPKNFCLALVEE